LKDEEIQYRCDMLVQEKNCSTSNWHYKEMENPAHVAIDCYMEYRGMGSPVFTDTG